MNDEQKLPDEQAEENKMSEAECVKCCEYKLGWQRATADYQNLKKEVELRKQEWAQFSEQQILEEFIPVYDNFKKAFSHHPKLAGENEKQIKNWISGIEHIMRQYGDVLKAHGVSEIKTVGEAFDPGRHESVGEEDVVGVKAGEIVRESEGGYIKNGRVIKPAKVIIAK